MKLSVLMSVYAKENPDFFSQALASVLDQTLMPDEVLIVEDGPLTDDLYDVIAFYQKTHPDIVRTLPLQKNVGLGLALNAGIKACTHEWIARMDTDDFAERDRFKKQMAYIHQHPELDVVGSNVTEYDETMNQAISLKKVPEHQQEIQQYIKTRNPFNHMAVVYKKQSILAVDSYEDCLYFEDYYLWCKLAAENGTFYNLPDSLVKVRAGSSLANRRGGLAYVACIYNFELKIYKLGIISRSEFFSNFVKRSIIALIPNKIRVHVYKKALRSQA